MKQLLLLLCGWLNAVAAMSKWTPLPMFGGIDICFDTSSCPSNSVQLYLVGLEEVDFANSIEYGFSDPVYTSKAAISYNTASFSAAFPTDLSSEPHALQARQNETTVSCAVTHSRADTATIVYPFLIQCLQRPESRSLRTRLLAGV